MVRQYFGPAGHEVPALSNQHLNYHRFPQWILSDVMKAENAEAAAGGYEPAFERVNDLRRHLDEASSLERDKQPWRHGHVYAIENRLTNYLGNTCIPSPHSNPMVASGFLDIFPEVDLFKKNFQLAMLHMTEVYRHDPAYKQHDNLAYVTPIHKLVFVKGIFPDHMFSVLISSGPATLQPSIGLSTIYYADSIVPGQKPEQVNMKNFQFLELLAIATISKLQTPPTVTDSPRLTA